MVAEFWNEKSLIDFFIRNIFELAPSQVDPAVSESISSFLWGIGEYFSLFRHDISFNPGSGYIALERDLAFKLTCLHTEAAPDALVRIYEKYPPERLWRGMNGKGPDDFSQPSGQCYGDGSFDGQFKKFSPVHLFLLTRFGRLMRIMTEHARKSRVVPIRVDTFDLRPLTGRIGKISVASEAKFASFVDRKFWWIRRMSNSGPVAVFTFNNSMRRGNDFLSLLRMAGRAEFLSPVFGLDGLPFLYICLPVPAIRIPAFMDSEIIRHQ